MELMALLYDILQQGAQGRPDVDRERRRGAAGERRCSRSTRRCWRDHHVIEFITDYLRMMVSGNLNAHEIENLMDNEIETHHHEADVPCARDPGAGRRPAGLRHRRRGAGRGEHHGLGRPAAGGARQHDRRRAGRHLPRHPAGLRLRRAARRACSSRRSTRATKELQCIKTTLLASMQGYAPAGRGRVRPQGALLDRAADLHRARGPRQEARSADAPGRRPMPKDKLAADHRQAHQEGRPGGHHGGAWKIAYADFVTAMMAFFLLMWLLGSTAEGDLKGIADYFNDAAEGGAAGRLGRRRRVAASIQGGGTDLTRTSGPGQARRDRGRAEAPSTCRPPKAERARAGAEPAGGAEGARSSAAIDANAGAAAVQQQIRLDMTPDGLRIQIVDEQNRPMFDSGSAVRQDPTCASCCARSAALLDEVPNRLTLSGPHRRRAVSSAASAATATGSCRPTAPTRRAAS